MTAEGNYVVESDIDNWDTAIDATETFATTAVVIATDRITTTNDIPTGTEIVFSSTGVLPDPLVTGTVYYATRIDATHITVATNPVNAADGTVVDLADVGSGTHTLDIGSGSSTADRQAIINQIEAWIEEITKDFFYAKAFVKYLDGNGKDRLFLGFVPDVLSVTEVLIAGIELTSTWYTSDANSVYLDPEAVTTEEGDMAELHLRMKYERTLFPRGMGNIKVTGTYGVASCPVAIKRIAIILCRANNDSTLYPASSGAFKSERLGDYSYTKMSPSEAGTTSWTGIDEVDKVLKHYIRKKPMLGAV